MIVKFMPVDEKTASRTADLFATLSDPNRACILSALLEHEELNVGALATCLGMSELAISHQLRGLRQMRIVRSRKEDARCSMQWMMIMLPVYFNWV